MTADEWQRIKAIFSDALEREGCDRAAFIQGICELDPAAGLEVKRLVAEHERAADRFLEQPVAVRSQLAGISAQGDETELARRDSPEPSPPQFIGPYAIVREIGRGGMGTVYLAERADGHYRKRAAIKVVNPYLGGDDILRRFRNERQILASLDHPNIAHLLDGGATAEGTPYLVMEYVEGVDVDAWCRSRKPTLPERLKLFQEVCAAVEYAHNRQIIHRDIKPGNIFVSAGGIPVLLDFGIAKVLSHDLFSETVETATGFARLTPDYASPEQVSGGPVGPAADIYALGVVLYRLLTGRLPYGTRGRDYAQWARIICEQEPVKPSVAARPQATSALWPDSPGGLQFLPAGDLDKILLKALRKEPERRYASAAELSEDIERFLHDMPVRARGDSLLYRTGKLLKRNRVPALTAVMAGALILVAVVASGRLGSPARGPNRTPVLEDAGWNHLRFEKVASLGDPAPGGGSYVSDFEPYGSNRRGDLVFAADLSTGGEGAFVKRAGTVGLALARQGQPAPGGGTFEGSSLGHLSINAAGDIAFVFGLKPFNAPALRGFVKAGLYLYSRADGKVKPVVIPGVTIAPGFGTFESAGQHACLNDAGDIVFPGVVRTTQGVASANGFGQGIFLADRNGRITRVAAPGDPAPGGSVFDFAANPWINGRGDIAFGAHVAGEECVALSPGCLESVYLKRAAIGKIESIAHQGGQAPNGNFYRGAWGPALNNSGDLVFMGELTPMAGLNSARGIFLHSGGVTTAIARPGDIMPDGRRVLTVNPVSSAGNYSQNDHGEIAFNAALEGGESGLYVYSRGAVRLVAATGTVMPGVGAVAGVAGLAGGSVSNAGQVFFWATLKDGRGVLLLATPSHRE